MREFVIRIECVVGCLFLVFLTSTKAEEPAAAPAKIEVLTNSIGMKLAPIPVGKFVMGTVKGDVHDIGKNLVDIICTNNGYEVHNLGIKIPISEMLQKVKDADVVITNPEHFAVALSYDPTGDGAPLLLAKGSDFLAQRIREEAEKHGVEMFAAPPLARALYFSTEVDQAVPESLYLAVAQVIAYVFSLADVRPGVAPMLKPQPKVPASMLFDANGKLMTS